MALSLTQMRATEEEDKKVEREEAKDTKDMQSKCHDTWFCIHARSQACLAQRSLDVVFGTLLATVYFKREHALSFHDSLVLITLSHTLIYLMALKSFAFQFLHLSYLFCLTLLLPWIALSPKDLWSLFQGASDALFGWSALALFLHSSLWPQGKRWTLMVSPSPCVTIAMLIMLLLMRGPCFDIETT